MILNEVDLSIDYFMNFTCIVASFLSLMLPWWLVKPIVSYVAPKILSDESADFVNNHYLPELGEKVSEIHLPSE